MRTTLYILTLLAVALAAGCNPNSGFALGKGTTSQPTIKLLAPEPRPFDQVYVPPPIDQTLPHVIRIEPLTKTGELTDTGGVAGIEVSIKPADAFGDATKAFGQFRFELFHYSTPGPDHRGPRIAVWDQNIEDPKKNNLHWNRFFSTYQFKLGWSTPIPIGRKYILLATYQSRFGPRLFDERVFVSGQ